VIWFAVFVGAMFLNLVLGERALRAVKDTGECSHESTRHWVAAGTCLCCAVVVAAELGFFA